MLISLDFKGFRQFKALHLEPLSRVNLIAGRNNTGKTAILEGLMLLFGDGQINQLPSIFRSAVGSSRDDFDSYWRWLTYQKSPTELMGVEARDDKKRSYVVSRAENSQQPSESLVLEYALVHSQRESWSATITATAGMAFSQGSTKMPRAVSFATRSLTPVESTWKYNQIAAKKGGRQKLTELLRRIEPRLQELQYLKLGDNALVYADVGLTDLIPAHQLGQGFVRLMQIYAEVLLAEAKIVLIDEIENGIDYHALSELWQGLQAIAAQNDVQIFATTHSYECIRSASEVFATTAEDDLAVHRLEFDGKQEVRVVTIREDVLGSALEIELEVR